MARPTAATSSSSEVKGICAAITLSPPAAKGATTLAQLDPSAQAPWTNTTVTSFEDIRALRNRQIDINTVTTIDHNLSRAFLEVMFEAP